MKNMRNGANSVQIKKHGIATNVNSPSMYFGELTRERPSLFTDKNDNDTVVPFLLSVVVIVMVMAICAS